ncbi:helix-turn-helix domain-containing protein [Bacillus pseudomycoides]|uniref:helix-turn-helix domain-containing protein n=1 Tax=Bacillus pseudomycoides TaxID=64104 RepID=UPI000BFA81A0|nr:helix-turn-helix domain-containing protein [Bacillus pseudomycoides]PFY57610.1 hypothetical protein COL49_14985 [Bacillus pseudomycoides]PGE00028.1 hypothetical protein COM50_07080 [Bacillus pseudomycoides]
MLDHIIGVEEAAEILGLSPGTVKNKCAAGELLAKKIGKTWILDKNILVGIVMENQLRKEIFRLTSSEEYTPHWVTENIDSLVKQGVKLSKKNPNYTIEQVAFKIVDSCY